MIKTIILLAALAAPIVFIAKPAENSQTTGAAELQTIRPIYRIDPRTGECFALSGPHGFAHLPCTPHVVWYARHGDSMTGKLKPNDGATAGITYLNRTFDPMLGLEETVVNNPYFGLARVILLQPIWSGCVAKRNPRNQYD